MIKRMDYARPNGEPDQALIGQWVARRLDQEDPQSRIHAEDHRPEMGVPNPQLQPLGQTCARVQIPPMKITPVAIKA
jgi:hypothetical protein